MELSYLFYFLIAVGLTVLLSAAFGRFRDEPRAASRKEHQEFERRMAEVEKQAEQVGVKRKTHSGQGASKE